MYKMLRNNEVAKENVFFVFLQDLLISLLITRLRIYKQKFLSYTKHCKPLLCIFSRATRILCIFTILNFP